MAKAIGIDLGGTHIKGVLINECGDILHQTEQATLAEIIENGSPGSHWKNAVFKMIADLRAACEDKVAAIGIAAPGLPNEFNSTIRVLPKRLNGLENFEWSEYIDADVRVLNDAHAALTAESCFGAGKGVKNIVMLTLGTGVGGGILINGEIYQGNFQMAGHMGHMSLDVDREDPGITGMPGSLENCIGNATIESRSFGRFTSTDDLVKAYQEGDTFATYIWLNSVRKLALGLCSLRNILSPDLIILGGGITKAGAALYQPLQEFISVYEWKDVGKTPAIVQASYSHMAGAVGAAGFALNKLLIGQPR